MWEDAGSVDGEYKPDIRDRPRMRSAGPFPTGTKSFGPGHAAEQGIGVTLRQDGSRTGTSFRIAGESGRVVPGHGTGGTKGGTDDDALIEQIRGSPSGPRRDGLESGRTVVVDVGFQQFPGYGVCHSTWAWI